jgi:chitodextrinase
MTERNCSRLLTCLFAILTVFAPAICPCAPIVGNAPRNLQVSGVTDWTVGLKWDAPKGKAPASYVVQCSNGRTMSVPATQTVATFSNGFDYNRTYSFRAYAVSSSGSWSGASNTVAATLLSDTTPPTKPVVSATAVGPTHIDATWSTYDASPILRFDIFVNGLLWQGQLADTSKRITFLKPTTSYTLTVRARDAGGNWSAMSDPLVVTTLAADQTDISPPSTPPGFWGDIIDGDTEAMIFWGNSTDNVTPQALIQYHVFLNGTFEGATISPYPNQYSLYLTRGIVNTIELVAIDEAGNRSNATKIIIDMRSP